MDKARKIHRRRDKEAPVTLNNYETIARGLRLKIGPGSPILAKQLKDRGLAPGVLRSLQSSYNSINSLYLTGYDVEPLWVQFVEHVRTEIRWQLPF